MIPENPILAIYVLGIYGHMTLLAFALIVRPHNVMGLINRDKKPKRALYALLFQSTIGWPVGYLAFIAAKIKGRI